MPNIEPKKNISTLIDERITYDKEICATLSHKLSRSHFIELANATQRIEK